jgi:hypothetical protein
MSGRTHLTVIALSMALIAIAGNIPQVNNVYGVHFSSGTVSKNASSSSTTNGGLIGNAMIAGVAVSNPLSESGAKSAKDAGLRWIRTDIGIATTVQHTYSVASASGLSTIGVVSYWIVDKPDSFNLGD